jgi:hypothetical protein
MHKAELRPPTTTQNAPDTYAKSMHSVILDRSFHALCFPLHALFNSHVVGKL